MLGLRLVFALLVLAGALRERDGLLGEARLLGIGHQEHGGAGPRDA